MAARTTANFILYSKLQNEHAMAARWIHRATREHLVEHPSNSDTMLIRFTLVLGEPRFGSVNLLSSARGRKFVDRIHHQCHTSTRSDGSDVSRRAKLEEDL
jgi:hypothetical protein